MKNKTWLVPLLSMLILQGCVAPERRNFDDIEKEMFRFVSDDTRSIAALPEIKEVERFSYNPIMDRNIFELLYITKKNDDSAVLNVAVALPPDRFRVREQLEGFDITELKYIGMMSKGGEKVAIIKDLNGISHIVREGNFLGENSGKVIEINKTHMVVDELINNGNIWVHSLKKIYTTTMLRG
jgi:type IV pilus assembly protein PilP